MSLDEGVRNALLAHTSAQELEVRVTDRPQGGAELHVRDLLTGRTAVRELTERQLLDPGELGVVLGDVEAELRPTRPRTTQPDELEQLARWLPRLQLEVGPVHLELLSRTADDAGEHVTMRATMTAKLRLRTDEPRRTT